MGQIGPSRLSKFANGPLKLSYGRHACHRTPGGFTTPSDMPGALIEPLFLSDPFEASIAGSPHGQQLIAEGMAAAVERYFTTAAKPR